MAAFSDDAGSVGSSRDHGKLQLPLADGRAVFPSLKGSDQSAVIVVVTFAFPDMDEMSARLDVQKQMFIDRIPETLDARKTAQAISHMIRADNLGKQPTF
jgi:hypothetical protein